jgi:hypothetical protein
MASDGPVPSSMVSTESPKFCVFGDAEPNPLPWMIIVWSFCGKIEVTLEMVGAEWHQFMIDMNVTAMANFFSFMDFLLPASFAAFKISHWF